MGTKKLSGARKVFFSLVAHALKAISAPPRFLNLINSPRLNCKDSPRTSSALALNCADSIYFRMIVTFKFDQHRGMNRYEC